MKINKIKNRKSVEVVRMRQDASETGFVKLTEPDKKRAVPDKIKELIV